jgi:RNA polymerase sigma factor (sigma-70 family)
MGATEPKLSKRERDALVLAHTKMARAVALRRARTSGSSLSVDDLYQEAMIGLMRAAELFDPDAGYAFTTYAQHWANHMCRRAIDNLGYTIRAPVGVDRNAVPRVRSANAPVQRGGAESGKVIELIDTIAGSGDSPEELALRRIDACKALSLGVPAKHRDLVERIFVKGEPPTQAASALGITKGLLDKRKAAVVSAMRKAIAEQSRAPASSSGQGSRRPRAQRPSESA